MKHNFNTIDLETDSLDSYNKENLMPDILSALQRSAIATESIAQSNRDSLRIKLEEMERSLEEITETNHFDELLAKWKFLGLVPIGFCALVIELLGVTVFDKMLTFTFVSFLYVSIIEVIKPYLKKLSKKKTADKNC